MNDKTADSSQLERDILEWDIPEEVLAVLLKDRSTGKNLIWATDDYAARGKGFGANDEMQVAQIADKGNPVIRPRVDKNADEQRQRSVKRAEVFTPSWICNKQNNLVRVVTENIGTGDIQDWLYYAKRAVQSVYGFDWQGDNVLLARENVLFTVVESFMV